MNEPAPLAHADLEQLQGLTLEDLEGLHGDGSDDEQIAPTTLEMSAQDVEQLESAVGFEMQAHAGQVPTWAEDLNEGVSPDKQLRSALVLSLAGEEVHLDQKDDLREISNQVVKLFQETLPASMQRLSQFLHAREQSDHLYDRLSELSTKRGSALEIIQTAKQIENMEKVLQGDRQSNAEIAALDQELAQMAQVINGYREICRIAQELS